MRTTATQRMARLLAVIPWVAARDRVSIDEVVARFSYPRAELLQDLNDVLFFVGVPPYGPGDLIEVSIDDRYVTIRYADWFSRPMHLSPQEGLALLAAGRSVLALDAAGMDLDEPAPAIVRGLAKLQAALGDAEGTLDIRLGEISGDVLGRLQDAISSDRQVRIDYYSYGRDAVATRVVDPHRVFSDDGSWYLIAWCHLAGDERRFRVDRIRALEVLDTERVVPPSNQPHDGMLDDAIPRMVLDVDASARWVAEQYPHDSVEAINGGRLRITLPVTEPAWVARLLLRLGPTARVLAAPPGLGTDAARRAAARVLTRYRSQSRTPQ